MLRLSLAALVFGLGASISTFAFAATVTPMQGQVLLNQGQGFRLVEGATEAKPGDTVVVNPGGSAQIGYDDGCIVPVQPLAVVAIASQSPCQTQQTTEQPIVSGTTIAVGAAILGVGVAAAIIVSQKDKPASP